LFVDYNTGIHDHTLTVRFDAPNTVTDAMGMADEFLDGCSEFVYTLTIQGARWSDVGETISHSVAWSGSTAYGDGVANPWEDANMLDFVGRSFAGRRSRAGLFACKQVQHGLDFRITSGEDANIGAVVTLLNGFEGAFLSIEGGQPIWKEYANLGPNAYWRNKIR
jgi:hypothetical protein